VIGCLSAKSLSLWKHHHNVFVFLHKLEFPDVSIIHLFNYLLL